MTRHLRTLAALALAALGFLLAAAWLAVAAVLHPRRRRHRADQRKLATHPLVQRRAATRRDHLRAV